MPAASEYGQSLMRQRYGGRAYSRHAESSRAPEIAAHIENVDSVAGDIVDCPTHEQLAAAQPGARTSKQHVNAATRPNTDKQTKRNLNNKSTENAKKKTNLGHHQQ